MVIEKIRNLLYIKVSRVFQGTLLRLQGVEVDFGVDVIGMPFIQRLSDSRIVLKNGVRLISNSWATALGINHRVIIRTLQSGALILIGEGTGISGGSFCAAKSISIGVNCLFGANVTVVDSDFHHVNSRKRRDPGHAHADAKPIMIENNVFVGTNSIILKGVTIGENSVIGAGSVVTKSIPSNVIAAGNPCRVICPVSLDGDNEKA